MKSLVKLNLLHFKINLPQLPLLIEVVQAESQKLLDSYVNVDLTRPKNYSIPDLIYVHSLN